MLGTAGDILAVGKHVAADPARGRDEGSAVGKEEEPGKYYNFLFSK
jgi:hypothetical protein